MPPSSCQISARSAVKNPHPTPPIPHIPSPTISVADLFCGAGGSSTGVRQACDAAGLRLHLTAINHSEIAIATHTANHPGSRHYCASLDTLNPLHLYAEDTLDILVASPECTHHSIARGGKPMNDQSRSTAWCVVHWAEKLRPKVILIENVKEFLSWGPIGANGRPLPSKRGDIFRSWVKALESIGYRVEWRILCAADYGDPTTRRRLFIYAVRGRRKIIWPEPTHSPVAETDLLTTTQPWVPARQIIDWTLTGRSIYGRKKPLAAKTMRRIMAGLEKYGLAGFIVPQFRGGRPVHSTDEPLATITTTSRGVGLCQPYILEIGHDKANDAGGGHRVRSVDVPVKTIPCANRFGLAQPFLVHLRGTSVTADLNKPAPAITAGGGHLGLTQPYLIKFYGTADSQPITDPVGTVTTKDRFGLCDPRVAHPLSASDGERAGERCPTHGALADFLDAASDGERAGERCPLPIIEINGQTYLLDILFRMLKPSELAAAQGFPATYKFTGNIAQITKQIGNAVPVNLAAALATSAIQAL